MPKIRLFRVDVGWGHRLEPGPTRMVLISEAKEAGGWPPDNLLRIHSKEKGVWGTMDPEDPGVKAYEDQVVQLVEQQIEDKTLIVLPEFAGSPAIEKRIHSELNKRRKHCVVIAGSYYRVATPKPHNNKEIIECVCPVLIPDRNVFYQNKFEPAPIEQPGFDKNDHPVLVVFEHTGFGDFSVIICSDALELRSRQPIAALHGWIDFLIVPARNKAPQLPHDLQTISNEERWSIAYCNGSSAHPSSILSPYSSVSGKSPNLAAGVAYIDLSQFQDDLAAVVGPFHTPTGPPHPYKAPPRHPPFRSQAAIDFDRYLRVLAVGSHFDDVWLGCSGTLMRLQECYEAQVVVVTLCNRYPNDYYGQYDLSSGAAVDALDEDLTEVCRALGFHHLASKNVEDSRPTFIDGRFNEEEVRPFMRQLASYLRKVDMLFIPRHDDDIHRDHIVTARAALTEFRGANVLEYEIKDFRRRPFQPNVLVDLSILSNSDARIHGRHLPASGKSFAEKKAVVLENAFRFLAPSDLPPAFQRDHTLGRMAFRASQSGTDLRYTEAFVGEIIV